MANENELDERLAEFNKRMESLKEKEDAQQVEQSEKLRQEYLRRTGRKDLTP
jgi:hypothetical protein